MNRIFFSISSIFALFSSRAPFAILFAIIAVYVNSIQFKTVRLCSNIFVKVFELQPPLTNSDASTAVVWPIRIFNIGASLNHSRPRIVSWTVCHSMLGIGFGNKVVGPTPTRFCVSLSQFLTAHNNHVPAYALTEPTCDFCSSWSFVSWSLPNNCKLSKCESGKYLLVGHNVGLFNVVSSGGHSASTGDRRAYPLKNLSLAQLCSGGPIQMALVEWFRPVPS